MLAVALCKSSHQKIPLSQDDAFSLSVVPPSLLAHSDSWTIHMGTRHLVAFSTTRYRVNTITTRQYGKQKSFFAKITVYRSSWEKMRIENKYMETELLSRNIEHH